MQQLPKQASQPKIHQHDPATKSSAQNQLTFYPAYCFKASETYTKWVKLTALDIHSTLKPHENYTAVTTDAHEYAGGLLLFYLNHPVQFIQVVGVVVVFENYFEKFWLFTVDDSSGETIDVCCAKPQRKENQKGVSQETGVSHKSRHSDETEDPDAGAKRLLYATIAQIDIGTVVQAKGVITTFRSVRQIQLIRLSIVPSTSYELGLISSRSRFLSNTLSKPWMLSPKTQQGLLLEAQGEHEGKSERERKRRERRELLRGREERHAKRIWREYEREEKERKKSAEQARAAAETMRRAPPAGGS